MDKAKKKNIKRIISLVCAVAVVILLAAMPLIAKQDPQEDGPQASILTGTVSTGEIHNELIGGGTLAEDDAVTVSVPAAVKLTKFLVSNGDTVIEGTPIATVDRVTVMIAIAQVQKTLEYLSEEIEDAGDVSTTENVTALAGGTVKILYARQGDSVQSVMLEHGALAVLSLDGLMAVDMETESAQKAGTVVDVTLADGTVVTGKIVKNLMGEMTVTVEDKDYAVGETVQITGENGEVFGSGELYIYSPWNATAYAGTVGSVKVKVGDKLTAGKVLMTLNDVGYSAAYRQLISQRQEYEEMMLELFKMYQTETVTAPCDGVVSGIDKNSLQLLADSGKGYVLRFLANSPNGDDETLYENYVGQVAAVTETGWMLKLNPQNHPIADYMALEGIPVDTSLMTMEMTCGAYLPVYSLKEGGWMRVDSATIGEGDVLLFAMNEDGFVWGVLIQKGSQPGNPDTPADPSDPTTPNNPTIPGGSTTTPGFGNWGSMGGMIQQEPAFELYSLEMADIAAVTPQDDVTLEITVDELDVTALQVGMTAQVKIDALGGQKYTATITEIGNTGTNNGGSSKYTVELTMDRAGDMLAGMNATATIILSTVSDVLTIPAAALVEQGNQTVVYTGYDEEQETLLNPVEVIVGSSDGENVEILEGLDQGQTYYYAYYDTLEISFTPDFGGGFMFG